MTLYVIVALLIFADHGFGCTNRTDMDLAS
jgi:hypothetical protein